MAKSMSSSKQVLTYIGVLLCGLVFGIAIGFTLSRGTQSSMVSVVTENTADCASVAVEPTEEVLGSPVFRHPGVIHSSKDGLILVRWNEVKGAKTYQIRVWNEGGTEIKKFDTDRTFTFLKNLQVDPKQKETPYFVVVTPLGETPEVRGKDSERKQVAMLPLRNLDPPAIKSIHTEMEEQPTN